MQSGRVNISEVHKAYGNFKALDGVSLDIKAGEFLTLLGPSGSGKTTLLNVIAGFERPDQGSVQVDDVEFITCPPHKRDLGMVFQNYALFPHMDVFTNIAYPLKLRKVDKSSTRKRVMDALEVVHLQHLANRRITELSGGQCQRVALARAFVFEPRLLLMDEPLSALDKNLREHMQIELKRLHKQLGMTTIYVTHDQQEALTMSDRIAVLDKGKIVQLDEPATIYDRPNCKFVAGFMGETRFVPVERRDQSYFMDGKPLQLADTRAASSDDDNWLMVRPERLRWEGEAGRDNSIEGKVLDVVFRGNCNEVSIELSNGHEIAIRHSGTERQSLPKPGDTLTVWLPAEFSLVIGSAAA